MKTHRADTKDREVRFLMDTSMLANHTEKSNVFANTCISVVKKIIPQSLFHLCQFPYHYLLALLGALCYCFPSRKIMVVAVTGTKGKSTVTELVSAVLEEAGFVTALANTIRFKVGADSRPNQYKMTMPGRFFLQKFLRRAVRAGCTHAVIEMTSEGARQFRHKFIELDALIFTNLAPEHIESHGSYENYVAAKVSIAKALEKSPKKNKVLVVNGDDKESQKFLDVFSGEKIVYKKQDARNPGVSSEGVSFALWKSDFPGKSDFHSGTRIESKLPGEFNLYNLLAAATYGAAIGIATEKIKTGIEKVKSIRGRAEKIDAGQDFSVIVDYAHTPDSLEKLYQTFAGKYRICVLGNTGGGRDKWKRPVMGAIAEKYCDEIILTNEDPYDEDPEQIIREMTAPMQNNPLRQHPFLRGKKQPTIILDRREAIRAALSKASRGDAVLITGKGTDPYIMGPSGSKLSWDDATVAREELKRIAAAIAARIYSIPNITATMSRPMPIHTKYNPKNNRHRHARMESDPSTKYILFII